MDATTSSDNAHLGDSDRDPAQPPPPILPPPLLDRNSIEFADLLDAYFHDQQPSPAIAEAHGITFRQFIAWSSLPFTRFAIAEILDFEEVRARHLAARNACQATHLLVSVVESAQPTGRTTEPARKAASNLLRMGQRAVSAPRTQSPPSAPPSSPHLLVKPASTQPSAAADGSNSRGLTDASSSRTLNPSPDALPLPPIPTPASPLAPQAPTSACADHSPGHERSHARHAPPTVEPAQGLERPINHAEAPEQQLPAPTSSRPESPSADANFRSVQLLPPTGRTTPQMAETNCPKAHPQPDLPPRSSPAQRLAA